MTTPNSYFPVYDGRANASDTLVQPWWIRGWDAQHIAQDTQLAINSNVLGPGFPTNLAFVNITGNYFDGNSSGIPGYITVQMSSGITVVDGSNSFRMPQRYTGSMNNGYTQAYNNWGNGVLYIVRGFLNIEVFCTDQTASGSPIVTDNGNSLFYFVTEHFMGGRTFHIQVPSTSAGTTVDINSLIVAGTIGEYKYDPVFPLGNMWSPEDDAYNTVGQYTGV